MCYPQYICRYPYVYSCPLLLLLHVLTLLHDVCRGALLLFLLPFGITAIACIVAAASVVAYAGTAALVRAAVAYAVAIVICAVTIAYGTADANGMWYMLLPSVWLLHVLQHC